MLGSKLQCFFGSNCCFCTRTSQAVKYRLLLRNKSWDLGIKLDLMHKDVHVGIAFRPHENQHDKKAWKLCTHTMSTFDYTEISSNTKYVLCHSKTELALHVEIL